MNQETLNLVHSAEQFIAAYGDGNVTDFLDYFEEIFKEQCKALREKYNCLED